MTQEKKKKTVVNKVPETEFESLIAEYNGKKYEFYYQRGTVYDDLKHVLSLLRDEVSYAHKIDIMKQQALNKQAQQALKEKNEAATKMKEVKTNAEEPVA